VETLKNLNHPNILKALDFIETEDSLFVVLEYVYIELLRITYIHRYIEGGSLRKAIKKYGPLPGKI
jgi:serine/threonine protein kinase